ncbi:MAG: helix-hairpin-helix domain-containing protein [candidate division Zixibacteria bacterium]|nr:helix-hairpin-helix domain-containing protein [candidate division Zixibacteria bacterium]
MDFFSFTPQESKAIIFLIVVLLIGSGVTIYKKYHPDFAPELLIENNFPEQKKVFEPARSSAISENINLKIPGRKVNLNTATLRELESLPGIGPELGRRILDYREKRGNFSTIDEIINVKGIGPKILEKFKNLITVE